jgi:S1-C subfamily serine protease
MILRWFFFGVLFILPVLPVSFALQTPMSQRQACAQFSDAVISINAGGQSKGTGFLVSSDGYILTASHVIRDEAGVYFSAISVKMPDGHFEFATPATPLTLDNVGQDFALLKVGMKDTATKLPFLALGSVDDVAAGSDATIIGYPFSAINVEGTNVLTRFCLSAEFAATDVVTVPVKRTNKTHKGVTPTQKDVKVDVVYFQGPSIKGISGSPIISRDTGQVVGIVSVKLTGISTQLAELNKQIAAGVGSGISLSGLEPNKAIYEIITVLDNQLANNLGAATGIDDPKYALGRTVRKSGR